MAWELTSEHRCLIWLVQERVSEVAGMPEAGHLVAMFSELRGSLREVRLTGANDSSYLPAVT